MAIIYFYNFFKNKYMNNQYLLFFRNFNIKILKLVTFTLVLIICFLIVQYIMGKRIEMLPINLTNRHECVIDKMVLIDYNGPKAQIIWKNNKIFFYCEVREAIEQYMNKDNINTIDRVYVQDFSNLSWGSYRDGWVNIRKVVFVIDSKRYGAMGISYVPFMDENSAKLFHKENGGLILKLCQINNEVLYNSEKKNQQILADGYQNKKLKKWVQII